MTLVIISHTEHYKNDQGDLVGWGPTVQEINHLLEIFDIIYHVAMIHDTKAPSSALPYSSENIIFVPIPVIGGLTLASKLKSILNAPKIISIVSKTLKQGDYFQFRAPTGMGVFLIPYLSFFVKKPGWFKYAGNWNQEHPPVGYKLQRWMLKLQKRLVTINGQWAHQPKHLITFENPCLNDHDIRIGALLRENKELEPRLTFCFVGRLEKEKGVERIIQAFKLLSKANRECVRTVHFVGEGDDESYFKSLCEDIDVNFMFYGALPREAVFDIYKESHFFLLPTTASEGFPKVIAEAMNFGCIPMVSNISAIGHYVKHNYNGFLMDPASAETLYEQIMIGLSLSHANYKLILSHAEEMTHLFTFSNYNMRIKSLILNE